MTRVDFTSAIVRLLNEMIATGEQPIIDFVKRSDEEQNRLFKAGKSKCDGKIKISAHQRGKAMDIFFVIGGKLNMDVEKYKKWHAVWNTMGGKPMIDWDINHFE